MRRVGLSRPSKATNKDKTPSSPVAVPPATPLENQIYHERHEDSASRSKLNSSTNAEGFLKLNCSVDVLDVTTAGSEEKGPKVAAPALCDTEKEIESVIVKRKRGIVNAKNNCYANAVLQLLSTADVVSLLPFVSAALGGEPSLEERTVKELSHVLTALKRETSIPVCPSRLLKIMNRMDGTQEDCVEFLRSLFQAVATVNEAYCSSRTTNEEGRIRAGVWGDHIGCRMGIKYETSCCGVVRECEEAVDVISLHTRAPNLVVHLHTLGSRQVDYEKLVVPAICNSSKLKSLLATKHGNTVESQIVCTFGESASDLTVLKDADILYEGSVIHVFSTPPHAFEDAVDAVLFLQLCGNDNVGHSVVAMATPCEVEEATLRQILNSTFDVPTNAEISFVDKSGTKCDLCLVRGCVGCRVPEACIINVSDNGKLKVKYSTYSVPAFAKMLEVQLQNEVEMGIYDCFTKYFEKSTIEDFKCSICSSVVNASRSIVTTKFGTTLFTSLLRFRFASNFTVEFDRTRVEVSQVFAMLGSKCKDMWCLCGVISYYPESSDNSRGHYVAFIKEDGQWFECDDHRVSLISWGEVKENVETNGYLLLFKTASPTQ